MTSATNTTPRTIGRDIQVARDVQVATKAGVITGTLTIPARATGVVIFAHGSGSSRHSTRNIQVAGALQTRGFATLLFDLLTPAEEAVDAQGGMLRFDIPLLAGRLVTVTDWVANQSATTGLPVGYFGASTGAGAALMAAAERPDVVRAVVSRGGRPDLAGQALARVRAPTLLIVGGLDDPVIVLNHQAMRHLTCEARLEIVPQATHLFPEPGTLERVSLLAGEWFARHLDVAGGSYDR